MTRSRVWIGALVLLLGLIGFGYYMVFGKALTERVTDRIVVLRRENLIGQIGANVIVYSNGSAGVVVDAQLQALGSATRSDVARHADPAVLLITHWHPDHSGGIDAFSSDTRVIAHENVLARLSAPQQGFGLTKPGSVHRFDARTQGGLPTETVRQRLSLATGPATIELVHLPTAHTDGDLVVRFPEGNVVAVGDLVWPGSFPYVDIHNGGSVPGLESALATILAGSKTGDRFIPGHGATLSYDEFADYVEMVTQTRRWVETEHANGRSQEQILASGLPQQWHMWSSRLVPTPEWIKAILASSDAKKSSQ